MGFSLAALSGLLFIAVSGRFFIALSGLLFTAVSGRLFIALSGLLIAVASLVALLGAPLVKNPPEMLQTLVCFWGPVDPLEKG